MKTPELWLVAALGRNRVIGRAGALPWHLPVDLAHFKRLTRKGVLLMGRRTWESIGCRPLPGRRILVLSSRSSLPGQGAEQVASLDQALELCRGLERLWVAGGQTVYEECLPRATGLELTRVELAPPGDAFFPEFDERQWVLEEDRPHAADEKNPLDCRFQRWRRPA